MPTDDTLTPREAAHIATNCYFTLKDWINNEPTAGVESRSNIHNRVLGAANVGSGDHPNTSLARTGLKSSSLGKVHSADTGFGTNSGFGYTLTYEGQGKKHVVIATRGTRPELGAADVITDLRAGYTSFGDCGSVHKGFKRTFDSILPNIERDAGLISSADVIHCVGHSLGGAVATLVAAHFSQVGKAVKLYTFGSPRVGCFGAYETIQSKIGKQNIYRVAHDLDPISYIAPFPYVHVVPAANDDNNMTLLSPTGRLLSTANHDMREYIKSVGSLGWDGVRKLSNAVDYDNALLSRWLLHDTNDPGWVTYASANTLSILFKLFSHVLRGISTSLILGLTAVDLLAEILLKGMHKLQVLGAKIFQLLKYAAIWAGIKAVESTDFTASVIRLILAKMLSSLKSLTDNALIFASNHLDPVTIGITGAWALSAAGVI